MFVLHFPFLSPEKMMHATVYSLKNEKKELATEHGIKWKQVVEKVI